MNRQTTDHGALNAAICCSSFDPKALNEVIGAGNAEAFCAHTLSVTRASSQNVSTAKMATANSGNSAPAGPAVCARPASCSCAAACEIALHQLIQPALYAQHRFNHLAHRAITAVERGQPVRALANGGGGIRHRRGKPGLHQRWQVSQSSPM